MIVYRLSRAKYKNDLSGKGAEIAGGRWNNVGIALLYTGQNRALCTAEIAVHTPLGITPKDYQLITIQLPKTKIKVIEVNDLPDDWKNFTQQQLTKLIGDQFVKTNKFLILKVPSAVVQGEFNFLINPIHKRFKDVQIVRTEPFQFDMRLFER